jgi:glycosyltransferase involved in cell wall biosynthesis
MSMTSQGVLTASDEIGMSVIIPLYNKASHIQRSIDSVLAQTYVSFELIVVDDGSTDGSGDVVRRYADPRIRLIVQQNAGVGAARNRGIAQARTRWIAFLDADDEWHPAFLERTLGAIQGFEGAVAVFTNYSCLNPNNTSTVAVHCDGKSPPRLVEDYFRFFLDHGAGICSSCVVVNREAIIKAGCFPPERKLGEDLDTWFRLACVGKSVYVSEVLATYHTGIGACAVEALNSDVWESYQLWLQADRIPEEIKASARAAAVHWRMETVLNMLRTGKRSDAGRLLAAIYWSELLTPVRFASYVACSLPLIPHALRWGIVRLGQKYARKKAEKRTVKCWN